MKIENLKINAFGNLKEKEINLSEQINVIQGKNETGKSTLLKFISTIFYGASKNKKGKEFSDYDKYKPWETEEFSGKLTYVLDNGKKYEVFRDFNKKSPSIYNEQLEDISKQFTIDKTYGNQFFTEQTNVDEAIFYSCLVSMQQEVKIEQNMQNILVQKVANLAGTGDDSISYKKAIEEINKKQIEEIGTTRTHGRPINIIKEEKFKLQDEIGELEEFKERKKQIEKQKEERKIELEKLEKILEIIRKIKLEEEKGKLEQEKINLSKNLNLSNETRKTQLEEEKRNLIKEKEQIKTNNDEKKLKNESKKGVAITFFVLGALLEILNIIFLKNIIFLVILLIEIIITIIWFILEIRKESKQKKKEQKINENEIQKEKEFKRKIEQIETEIKILKNNIKENQREIEEKEQKQIKEKNLIKEKLKLENPKQTQEIENLFYISNIQNELEKFQEEKNRKTLEYHSLELEEKNIIPKLERMSSIEEQLQELKEKEEKLEKDNTSIEIVKEVLEVAYKKMKQTITPKLTQELSKNIKEISNGKYTKINLHEEKGIIIEKENGEYIEAEKLSIGTIDQLYLSLRLAMVKELTNETMPIILDEAFAYYDEERLENILKYLSSEFKNNQIIIFTCTNREKEILNKLQIKYKNIEL